MRTVFISGVQRSGTTLLSVLLDRHRDIDVGKNALAFRLISCFGYYKDVLPYNLNYSWHEIQSWLIQNDYKGRLAELIDVDELINHDHASSVIESAIQTRLAISDNKIFGDKAPNLQHFVPDMLMLIPNAKFIHIVRDGRATAQSQNQRANKNLYLAAQDWMDGNIMGLHNEALLGNKKYKIVRYEDLLTDTVNVLKNICEFLEVEYDSNMISDQNKSSDDQNSYVKDTLDPGKIDEFKNKLSKLQIRKIEKIQRPLLRRFGYKLINDIEVDDHKQLSVVMRIWYNQLDNIRQLFISNRMGMIKRENVPVKIPFSVRLKNFVFQLGKDFLPEKVFKRLFRKRWIKNVYLRK